MLRFAMLALGIAAWWWRSSTALLVASTTLWVLWTAQGDLARRWPAAREGERIVADCAITSLPQPSASGISFDAQCRPLWPADAAAQPLNLRLRLPPQPPALQPQAGEHWQWLLELHALAAPLNPGMIDAERQWYRERVHGLARQKPSGFSRRLTAAAPGLLPLRSAVAQAIAERVDDRDARALIAALAVGATGELTREQWRVFATTGITHLIAISGMHVTAFAMVAIALARWLWRRAPAGIRQRMDRERFALTLGLACAIAYAAIAGMSVPTQRTLVMLLIAAAARLSARRIAPLTLLSLAGIAVLLIDPYAPLAAGFWLSFLAVGVLMGLGVAPPVEQEPAQEPQHESQRPEPPGPGDHVGGAAHRLRRFSRELLGATRLQWLITFAMMPCTLALFGTVPLAGLLVNLLAIPLFSLALVPLTLAGMALLPASSHGIELAAPLWRLAEKLWLAATPWLQQAADWAGALWQPDVAFCWLLVSPLLVLFVLLGLPLRLRGAALLALLLPIAWPAQPAPLPGAAQVTLLDAGAGTAIIVRTASHALLFDTADVHGGEGAAVHRLVIPALLALGLRQLDRLVLSAMSSSRIIGAATLTSRFPVAELRAAAAWSSADRPLRPCAAAEQWRWDGIDFRWLDAGERAGCVLQFGSAARRVLLSGSIDAAAQSRLVQSGAALRSEVVVVPRNGSRLAASAEFAAAVAPRWALVVSDGRAANVVADRWRAAGAHWLSTHDCGAIQFTLSAHQVTTPRALFDSPWHWPWRERCPRQ